MLSSLCPVLAVISPVSRFCVTPVALQTWWCPSDGRRRRFALGFRAVSWQHRILDCGTLILDERCAGGT